MTRPLLLLSAALAAVIVAEISPWQHAANESGPVGQHVTDESGPVPARRPPEAVGRGAFSRTDSELARWVAVTLRRPLFAPNRRSARAAQTTVAAGGVPHLSGIVITPEQAVAIFRRPAGAKPLVAHAGDVVDGWEVSTIAANGVDLHKADAKITVTPEFDDGNTPARVVASQSVSRWTVAAPTGLLRARWSNPQLQP
jgi:hypothetical protein